MFGSHGRGLLGAVVEGDLIVREVLRCWSKLGPSFFSFLPPRLKQHKNDGQQVHVYVYNVFHVLCVSVRSCCVVIHTLPRMCCTCPFACLHGHVCGLSL